MSIDSTTPRPNSSGAPSAGAKPPNSRRIRRSRETARAEIVAAAEEALGVDHHGMAWPLLACALVVLRRRLRSPENAALLVMIVAMATVYAAVFVVIARACGTMPSCPRSDSDVASIAYSPPEMANGSTIGPITRSSCMPSASARAYVAMAWQYIRA